MSEFRKLDMPYVCRPATERSQAIGGVMVFGTLSQRTLRDMGVGDAMLDLLVHQCVLERHRGVYTRWYRLHPALALVATEDLGAILYPDEAP